MSMRELIVSILFILILMLAFKKNKYNIEKDINKLNLKKNIIVPVNYKLSKELENIVFPALRYVETEDRPIDIISDKFEKDSFGPCQIREISFKDANKPFRLPKEFRFKKFPIDNKDEYYRFVITYAGIILRDYIHKIPLESRLEDIKHIVLGWPGPTYYANYLKGLRPPLPDYKRRIKRLNRFLAREGYKLRFSTEPPFNPIYLQ